MTTGAPVDDREQPLARGGIDHLAFDARASDEAARCFRRRWPGRAKLGIVARRDGVARMPGVLALGEGSAETHDAGTRTVDDPIVAPERDAERVVEVVGEQL